MLNWLKTLPVRTLALLRAGLERVKRNGPPLFRAGLERIKTLFERTSALFRAGLERIKRDGLRWLRVGLSIVVSILVLGGLLWAVWVWWDWLATVPDDRESRSTTARNVGLVIGGVIAIMLALWRSIVAHRQALTAQSQALTAQSQALTAQSQAEIAQRRLMDERYQKATEMLGSSLLSVRLGGIYALQGLAEEAPEQYHVQIMRLLCAFVRNPIKDEDERTERDHKPGTATPDGGVEGENQTKTLREDVQAIMDAIATRSDDDIVLEKNADDFRPDLWNADLRHGIFPEGNLSHVNFFRADLSGAKFGFAGKLGSAKVDLSGAKLISANLSGATLVVTGLNHYQLAMAYADPKNPPILQDCFDAQTGKPLVWNGRAP